MSTKDKILNGIVKTAGIFETVLAVVVLIAVILCSIPIIGELIGSAPSFDIGFDSFLAKILGLVIGIEFVKMLTRHTPGAVVEVLLFAIARQLIVYHTSTLETLIGMAAVAAAFAIRKYLFVNEFDSRKKESFNTEKGE